MNRWLWTLAIVITLASALYQRMTGPSYPVRMKETVAGVEYKGRLPRTHSVSADLEVAFKATGDAVGAPVVMEWRKFPTDEGWTPVPMTFAEGEYRATIPAQPAAGKVEYRIFVPDGSDVACISGQQAVVARFKGDVPPWVLAPHIFFMFFAMLWSNRTGLEALADGPKRARMAVTTLLLLVVGGLLLGPAVQKYAFGAYWTGWPFGEDLTDNKLAVAVLFWVLAVLPFNKRALRRTMAVVAALVVLAVYMIPHSMNGSTLDHSTGVVETGALE